MSTGTQTWRDVLTVEDFAKIPDVESMVTAALQSQYAESPRIKALCAAFQAELDATPNLSALLEAVCDPRKASGVFLDWWAARVGVARRLTARGKVLTLNDEQLRFLIFYRAAANISNSSLYDMNRLLRQVIAAQVFVVDNFNMTVDLRVLGMLTEVEEFILKNYGLLTRGAGVGYHVQLGITKNCFGFNGSELKPFNVGPFTNATESFI